jgi:ankyrin repeat protein
MQLVLVTPVWLLALHDVYIVPASVCVWGRFWIALICGFLFCVSCACQALMSSSESKQQRTRLDEIVSMWHTRLVVAAAACDSKQLLALLDQDPSEISMNSDGDSLLHLVARGLADAKKHESAMQLLEQLLERGADPTAKNDAGETCIFYAACAGSLPGVKLLLLYLPVNERPNSAATPVLLAACKSGNAELVRYLVDQGAHWTAKDKVLSHAFRGVLTVCVC